MPGASSGDSELGHILLDNLSMGELLKALETMTLAGNNPWWLEGNRLTTATIEIFVEEYGSYRDKMRGGLSDRKL